MQKIFKKIEDLICEKNYKYKIVNEWANVNLAHMPNGKRVIKILAQQDSGYLDPTINPWIEVDQLFGFF